MRHGWKRFWRLVSAATAATAILTPGVALARPQTATDAQRHNELALAGLRPGRSKLQIKQRLSGLGAATADATGYQWANRCDGHLLRVEIESDQTVRTVTASALGPTRVDCANKDAQAQKNLRTGRGLTLGDPCGRVTELYGKPESRGPSVRGSRKLESLFYSFDWAGENVPQSMEISCDAAGGRVVEITLASSTL